MATNIGLSETEETDRPGTPPQEAPSVIEEGRAAVPLPPGVFYNPVQEFNRDLTVAVINQFADIFYREGIGRKANRESTATTGTETGEIPSLFIFYCVL